MKKNKRSITILGFVLLVIIYLEYGSSSVSNYVLPSKSVLYLDENYFKEYKQEFLSDKNINMYWNIAKEIKDEDVNATNDSNTSQNLVTEVSKEKDKNVLCIEKSCYRLLGIHYVKQKAFVTLYNKELKHKVKDYASKEMLTLGIIVKNIEVNSVEFTDANNTRVWKFEIFDVNQTKYKPKEIEE